MLSLRPQVSGANVLFFEMFLLLRIAFEDGDQSKYSSKMNNYYNTERARGPGNIIPLVKAR